jgi:aspartyl-tRNA(Asn)/glutamyl-tRNA(Gln) amidotransferase subunit A
VDLKTMSAGRFADAVNKGEFAAREMIGEVLENAEKINSELNIFCCQAGEEALEQAAAVDKKINSGICLPLAGVPLTVKDDLMYKALPASMGSRNFKQFIPPFSAAAVEKLVAAGAVVVGKTNLDNMSIGSTTLNSHFGPTINPRCPDRVAGSGGAAALSSGISLLALESDCGGALRQGSSHCGIFGLLPSAGYVSRHGLALHSSSFGRVALAAAHAEDLSVALKVISGYDPRDAATAGWREQVPNSVIKTELAEVTIGYPLNLDKLLDEGHLIIFRETLENITSLGVNTAGLEFKYLTESVKAYHVIAAAEASSTLSRFDGIRFGQAVDAEDLEELYVKTRRATFSRETARRSIFGAYFLSQGGYDRYYTQALKVWNLVRREFDTAFKQCDFLLFPVVRNLPPEVVGEPDYLELYESDLFTAPVSMAGNPAVCLPAGDIDGIPVGMQLIGSYFGEVQLLSLLMNLTPVAKPAGQRQDGGGS